MARKRKFEVAGFAAIAILCAAVLYVLGFLLAPYISPTSPNTAADPFRARIGSHREATDPRAYTAQLQAMRDLHRRALTANTPQSREAVASDSRPVMHAGINMMLRMKSALPASVSATGFMTLEPITGPEAQLVQDFLQLMDLLVELESDLDAAVGPAAHPRDRSLDLVDSPPAPERLRNPDSLLVLFGAGACHVMNMA
jgi:hypothetical protein